MSNSKYPLTDDSLRDKLASEYASTMMHNFATLAEADFKAGWDSRQSQVDELREEMERVKRDHAKFCEEAQEKTDADFKVVRDAAERAIDERDQLRQKLSIAKAALEFYANKDNWFDSDDNRGEEFMEIIDNDGYRLERNNHLIGGLRALQALEQLERK